MTDATVELRDSLRYRGLSPRALAAWAGTDRLSALAALVPRLAAREVTQGSALLALFVAGVDVAAELVRAELVVALERAELVERRGAALHARFALLPIDDALIACDRLDAPAELELACWPDDSSYHLARALPPYEHARWLDLGCGSAFAQLWRSKLAARRGAADLNPRALAMARLGAALSGVALDTYRADLGDGVPDDWRATCDLVSLNAPIPRGVAGDDPYRTLWRATDDDFLPRAFDHARALLGPGGRFVVHAALDPLRAVVDAVSGERVIVAYTPPGPRGFGVAWWRPHAEPLAIGARRELTDDRPHLTHRDLIAAWNDELPPL